MFSVSVLLAISLVCLVAYKHLVYPAFRSPLAKIPKANFTSSFSPLWILWARYRCREVRTIHEAHERLGPVVRLGPEELSVNCLNGGVRTIYGGNFRKHMFYPNLFTANSGAAVLFSEVESKPHARRKRLISNIYSKSVLQNSPTMAGISANLIRGRLMPRLKAAVNAGGEVEMFFLIVAITMDFITTYQFGLRNGTDWIRQIEGAHWWIQHFDNTKQGFFWPQELPKVTTALSRLGIQMVPESGSKSAGILEDWCLAMMKSADYNEQHVNKSDRPEDVPVHYQKLENGFIHEDEWPDAKKIMSRGTEPWRMMACAELLDNIGGAQEGTATAIFYILRELARNPAWQLSLRAEICKLSTPNSYTLDGPSMPRPKDIDSLPLLDAVIMETLRLFPPMAGPQPRVTPSNATIGPYTSLPKGVRVSSQPYSLHRNAAVFPEPESWKPERWTETNASQRAEMMNWFWGFSSGANMCIGSHFALQEIKLVTAAIVSNYSFEIVDDRNTDQMDAYSAQPISQRMVLKFVETV